MDLSRMLLCAVSNRQVFVPRDVCSPDLLRQPALAHIHSAVNSSLFMREGFEERSESHDIGLGVAFQSVSGEDVSRELSTYA